MVATATPKPKYHGFPSKGFDWEKGKKLFVESPQRPTYDELAVEIGCAPSSVARLSADQGWAAIRAQHWEQKLVECDAGAKLAEALTHDRTITHGIASFAITTIAALSRCVESIPEEQAASTRSQTITNCTFALKNLSESVKNVGLVGLAKTLPDAKGKDGWDPRLLQQINVTVQNLTAKEEAKRAVAQEVKEVTKDNPNPLPPSARPSENTTTNTEG